MSFLNPTNNNISRVLYTLWKNPGISRIDISKKLKLNKATITNIVSGLIEKKIVSVLYEGVSSPMGGRKPVYLTLNERYGYIIGIEVQQSQCIGVIVNLYGEIVYSYKQRKETAASELIDTILNAYRHLSKIADDMNIKLLGLGIGLGGIVDPFNNIVSQSYPLKIDESILISKKLEQEIDLPILVENDANCCCWAELLKHKNNFLKDFVFILSEIHLNERNQFSRVSIGLGIVINNYVHRGDNYSAGEFRSILRKEGNESQFSIPDEEINKILNDEELYFEIVTEIAKNVALIVNVLNTKYLFLGTLFEKDKTRSQEILKKYMQKNWSYPNQVNCQIKFSSMGELSVAYGAAAFFLNRMFNISDIDSIHKVERNISIFDYNK